MVWEFRSLHLHTSTSCIFSEKEETEKQWNISSTKNKSFTEGKKKKKGKKKQECLRVAPAEHLSFFYPQSLKSLLNEPAPIIPPGSLSKEERKSWMIQRYREATLEKKHLSQGNKKGRTKKSVETDREARWWTMFPICMRKGSKAATSSTNWLLNGRDFSSLSWEAEGGEGALQPLKWSMSPGLVDRERGKHFDRGCQASTARSRAPILPVALHQTGESLWTPFPIHRQMTLKREQVCCSSRTTGILYINMLSHGMSAKDFFQVCVSGWLPISPDITEHLSFTEGTIMSSKVKPVCCASVGS